MAESNQTSMNFAGLAVAMTIGALGIVGINLYSDRAFVEETLLKRARAHHHDIVIMRKWVASYGGVYVEKKPGVVANPYLKNPDVPTVDGRVFTLRNPALMVSEISAYTMQEGGYRSRVTSLKPLNPKNLPDVWEEAALRRLERGEKEVFERVPENGSAVFRYIAPLMVEPDCLGCHVEESYRVGEVRGGVSVSFDVSDTESVFRDNAIATGVAILLILFGVGQLMLLSLRRVRSAGRDADLQRRRFESLVQTTEGIVWEADPTTGAFTFVSNQAEALLGHPVANWLQPRFWADHVHPDDRALVLSIWDRCVRQAEAHSFEYRFMARDGETLWLSQLVSVVVEDGHPVALRGLMIDVTSRKEAEFMAREAQAVQTAILNNALVGIVYLKQRTVVHCNPRFEAIFGYGPGELVGCSTRLLYASEADFDLIGHEAYGAVGRGEPYSLEVLLRRKSGRVFWGALTGRALDPARPHDGSIWIYADISERKQAEEEAGKLLRAVEQSPVSIVITSRDGLIEYVNPRFCQVTGYAREEAIGQSPSILKSGETSPEVYRDLWLSILAGKDWRGVLVNRRKNGELFWEDASIAPVVNEHGDITRFIAVKEDITGRMQLDRELAQHREHLEELVLTRTHDLVLAMQQAKAADRAKSEFLTNMSHEMRTPLNAIIGFCQLAERTSMTAQQRDYLEKIDGASAHLLDLINNVLDLSKIAAGRVELTHGEFDPRRMLSRLASTFGMRASEKGLALNVRVAPEVPERLHGDGLRLKQVLINLMANAVKFTAAGEVSVDVSCSARGAEAARLSFVVTDTGIGMDAEEQRRAFEPFAQGDASITRRYGGTGLGLAISRELVGLMGGVLEMSSEKGQGSRFAFSLDFALAGAPSTAAYEGEDVQPDVCYRFDGVRVLVVEDQPLNRQVAEELLASTGVEVETAENGRIAVDRVLALGPGAFDVVLMDLQMPEFDGLSAMRAIRAKSAFRDLPLVALTAHVLEEERARSLAAGANDHLGKPFRPEELFATIARWVNPAKVRRAVLATVAEGADSAGFRIFGAANTELSWQEGLDRFDGHLDKYLGWLGRFADERGAVADEIGSLLAGGKHDEASGKAHSIKGLAGTLGLGRVQAAASELEQALRKGDTGAAVSPLRDAIASARKAILAAGDAWRTLAAASADDSGGGTGASGAVGAPDLEGWLERLAGLLAQGDGESGECAAECVARAAGTGVEGTVRKIADAVERFDFVRAEALVREMQRTMRGVSEPAAEVSP